MFEEKICPYPGLRPFNDDESIFFKGRERNIDTIIELFEKKKFMMLTGASGDGKSSLIYAGVVPHARAGLFKAKYNNWAVADFRPERDPLGNLTKSLNNFFKNDEQTLKKELSYGFSSLINIYKRSPLYLDTNKPEWIEADDAKKKALKRKACNLLIIADQFEEFFTNTENYHNGAASVESQTVVNVLLETAKIALAEDIPIYVICTMRSDYIGQCAAFRGLPEYIGFSQFFVPRLKRNEIQQVIEEPAILNGDKMTRRFSERLLNDITDGYDQLPILQHSLNQIWKIADNGKEEIDLIHYAMVGGLAKDQLPEADKKRFEEWFEKLPEFKKKLFEKPSLENILNAHADELYETSYNYSTSKLTKKRAPLSREDAKFIIKTSFQCLTKIDESRAVRNRMTLEEITGIINKPTVTNSTVGSLLDIFRLQGNTFLKPFLSHDDPDKKLSPSDVLDITHESLIRNWGLLDSWAKEENENWLNFQDFNKQLQRWIDSGKDKGYLLPIGPLTFFENWFNECKPNKFWLMRYDERELPKEEKLKEAENTIGNAEQFLKLSARRLFISRTVLKYGANKILAFLGIILLTSACIYYYNDFESKQNPAVLTEIQAKSEELLKSKFIKAKVKADYILVAERLNPGTYKNLLKKIENDSAEAEILKQMFVNCVFYQENKQDKEADNPLVEKLFWDVVNLTDNRGSNRFADEPAGTFKNNLNNVLHIVYGHAVMRRTGFKLSNESGYRNLCGSYFLNFIDLLNDSNSLKKIEINSFNILLQAMPEIVNYDTLRLKKIAAVMDPFNPKSKRTFDILYPKGKTVIQGWSGNISHNGGYYQLACLFALTKDFEKLNLSYDSIVVNNKAFSSSPEGFTYRRLLYNLIISDGLFTDNGKRFASKVESELAGKNNNPINIILINSLLNNKVDVNERHFANLQKPVENACYLQLQLEKISYPKMSELADKIIEKCLDDGGKITHEALFDMNGNEFIVAKSAGSGNETYYTIALLYKAKAFINDKKENINYPLINNSLKKAFEYYDKVSQDYLNGQVQLGEGVNITSVQRASVFKYGGLVQLTNGWDPFGGTYTLFPYKDKNIFIDQVLKQKGFGFYNNDRDWEIFNRFFITYASSFRFENAEEKAMNLQPFEEAISGGKLNSKIDKDALLAFLTVYYDSKKQERKSAGYAAMINHSAFLDKEKVTKNNIGMSYYNLSKSLLNYYFKTSNIFINDSLKAENGNADFLPEDLNYKKAFDLINKMPDFFVRRNSLLANIDSLQRGKKDLIAIPLLDTLVNSYIVKSSKFGNKLFEVLGRLNTNAAEAIAITLMKDKPDKMKPECLKLFIEGVAQSGNYYKALTFIPVYVSSSSQLSLYAGILKSEVKKQMTVKNGWSAMDKTVEDSWLTGAYELGENPIIFATDNE